MTADFGTGTSRTLEAVARQFSATVWQKGKPPLDSELNLMSQVDWENLRQSIRSTMPSGFLIDPTRAIGDYQFNKLWSNRFRLGNPRVPVGARESVEKDPVVWANVNGWVIPVVGTNVEAEGELHNVINLMPPPETDARIDYIFLEAWQTRIDSNPSANNKPSASTIWKYGNVEYGGTNLTDDLEDPTIGYETTARIQVQHRLRVHGGGSGLGSSVALDVYPDGLGSPDIYGQGTSTAPKAALGSFVNMRAELGDPGLWRAGDGNSNNDYGTIDGYVYAIPVCAVFRRGSNVYVAVNQAGNPTQNGAFNRTPSAKTPPNPSSKNLTVVGLNAPLKYTDGALANYTVSVTGLSGSGLDDPAHILSSVFIVIDGEIIGITSVSTIANTITINGRGRFGTAPSGHASGSIIEFYNTRPDGLFSDEIDSTDILDLRHGVNTNDWDYNRLLSHNVAELLKGNLRSAWKQSATGDTQGPVVHEVDYMYAGNAALVPNYTEAVDGTDGVRTVFSDAAVVQPEVTILLDNDATQVNGFVDDDFETNVAWDVSPGFRTSGFMNVSSIASNGFTDGSTILLYTGGATGNEAARKTFRTSGERGVRMLTPREYWKTNHPVIGSNGNQYPVSLRFIGYKAFDPPPSSLGGNPSLTYPDFAARHVGPMHPTYESNFERPYIVLGGVLHRSLKVEVPSAKLSKNADNMYEVDIGVDLDTTGVWFSYDSGGDWEYDPTKVTNPLFHGLKTMYGMMTANGSDSTGNSSEIYLVIYGDKNSMNNNGAFRVVGAGTVGYTTNVATNSSSFVVVPLSPEFTGWDNATGNQIKVETRSQYTHSEDTSSYDTGWSDIAIVLTDIGGQTEHPWKREYLGYLAADGYDLSLPLVVGPPTYPEVMSKMVLSTTLLYHPGHGATARVADHIVRFARTKSNPTDGRYLRQCPATLDPSFPGVTGAPVDETEWPLNHIQLWNRLPSLGLNAPTATNYGGNVVGYTEQDREHELFVDQGSKTIVFRPFRSREMTIKAETFTHGDPGLGTDCLLGSYNYPTAPPIPKDGLVMWTGTAGTGKMMGFPVPPEFMPRFGRQDIPYFQYDGEDPIVIMPGINHLFRDSVNVNNPVFDVIGGSSTTVGNPAVNNMIFLSADPSDLAPGTVKYGKSGTTSVGTNNQPFVGARLTTDVDPLSAYGPGVIDKLLAVNSSDFGRGLRGIQLPPYHGIARLCGVYDIRDFVSKTGHTISTTDRWSPDGPDPAPNLLKQDSDRQTLFIMQDGAKDYTLSSGDHTYIIPENTLDLTRCLNWDPNNPTDFANFDFVVVCTIFGFSRDWINGNNFVMVREVNGKGLANSDGSNVEIESIPMVIPCPAAPDEFYIAYNRTVYQGDVYMSRKNTAKTATDYQSRYGQLTTTQQYAMRLPIQQYDSSGNYVPQTPNLRTFEVLASMDFYTTMGTGKIGGQLYPGTPLDICYTENSEKAALRKPDSATSPMWQVMPRAFTEGQKTSDNRAHLRMSILASDELDIGGPASINSKAWVRVKLEDGTSATMWFSRQQSYAAMAALYGPENVIIIDETAKSQQYKVNYTVPGGTPTVPPWSVFSSAGITVTGATVGDSVIAEFAQGTAAMGKLTIHGWVDAADTVKLKIHNSSTPSAFEMMGVNNDQIAMVDQVVPATLINAHNISQVGPYVMTGLDPAKNQYLVVGYSDVTNDVDGVFFTAEVTGVNQYAITLHNPSAAALNLWPGATLRVVAFEKFDHAAFTHAIANAVVNIRVLHTPPPGWASTEASTATAMNAVTQIALHPVLSKSISVNVEAIPVVDMVAVQTGSDGNKIRVTVGHTHHPLAAAITSFLRLEAPYTNDTANNHPTRAYTSAYFSGGHDYPMNAGPGTSQVKLTGMTERLPTGALLQDSDFICENPMLDSASAVKSTMSAQRAIQSVVPLTNGGDEFTRYMGAPGEIVAQSDGSVTVTDFGAWRRNNVTGSRIFRLFRGGGPLFISGGETPGGPVDWVSDSFPPSASPVLKGGVLVCMAMLVRNFYEEVKPNLGTTIASDGDEIQMVIATYGMMGDVNLKTDGMTLSGVISPAGYGEGYAASDRYRLAGRPMFKGTVRQVEDPSSVVLAVYPDGIR